MDDTSIASQQSNSKPADFSSKQQGIVCMYVCMYVMYVWEYVCMDICLHEGIPICYECLYVQYVCMVVYYIRVS